MVCVAVSGCMGVLVYPMSAVILYTVWHSFWVLCGGDEIAKEVR